jgi:hypothetical protein
MCPSCGGEEFSMKKAQALWESHYYWKKHVKGGTGECNRGYVFSDGSVSLKPGNWVVPERVVKL